MDRSSDDPLGIVADLLPHLLPRDPRRDARVAGGEFHDVVLVPGTAAVRVTRRRGGVEGLRRSAELLTRLDQLGLPFAVPVPLGPVEQADGRAVLATSWVDGRPAPRGTGDPAALRGVLAALAAVEVDRLHDVLAEPHAYAGGADWYVLMTDEVVPRLPARWRAEARLRVDAAASLPPVTPGLVHGDLAGDNMRWDDRGRLVGILDWDLAAAWDPAVDAACLSWHGWDAVERAVDPTTYERARTWGATFGIEQVGAAIVRGDPPEAVQATVERAVAWLERTASTDG